MSDNDKCPDLEELSAWIDDQSTNDYSDHCASCESCNELVEDFRKTDAVMAELLNAPQADRSLPGKIMEEVGKKEVVKIDWFRHVVKIAAILAAAFVISNLYSNGSKGQPAIVDSDPVKPMKKPVNAFVNENINSIDTPPGAIPEENFKLVGSDSKIEPVVVTLPGHVKHVWISANPAETARLIKEITGDTGIAEYTAAEGKISMTISLTDKNLIKIVNSLSEKGAKLVSRELPQPNINNVKIEGRKVNYNLTVIKKN